MIASSSSPETFSALQVAKFKMLILLWLSTFLVMHMWELKCVKRTKLIFAFIYTSCLMEIVSTFYLKGMYFSSDYVTIYWNKPAFPFPRFAKTPLTKPFHFPFHFFPPTSNSICLATCFDHFQPMKFSLPKLKGYWADLSFPARFSPVCCSTPGRQNKNATRKNKKNLSKFWEPNWRSSKSSH